VADDADSAAPPPAGGAREEALRDCGARLARRTGAALSEQGLLAGGGDSLLLSALAASGGGIALLLIVIDETDNTFADIHSAAISTAALTRLDVAVDPGTVNEDDGDHNFKRGLISNRFDLLAEVWTEVANATQLDE
jgi:hypothetical protein